MFVLHFFGCLIITREFLTNLPQIDCQVRFFILENMSTNVRKFSFPCYI